MKSARQDPAGVALVTRTPVVTGAFLSGRTGTRKGGKGHSRVSMKADQYQCPLPGPGRGPWSEGGVGNLLKKEAGFVNQKKTIFLGAVARKVSEGRVKQRKNSGVSNKVDKAVLAS